MWNCSSSWHSFAWLSIQWEPRRYTLNLLAWPLLVKQLWKYYSIKRWEVVHSSFNLNFKRCLRTDLDGRQTIQHSWWSCIVVAAVPLVLIDITQRTPCCRPTHCRAIVSATLNCWSQVGSRGIILRPPPALSFPTPRKNEPSPMWSFLFIGVRCRGNACANEHQSTRERVFIWSASGRVGFFVHIVLVDSRCCSE